jgi:hypothetical protein
MSGLTPLLAETSAAVDFVSPWMAAATEEDEAESSRRHELFRSMVFDLLHTHCPWLLRILQAANAQILAGRGVFYIAIPAGSQDWIEIPALSARLHLMPWSEEGEVPQH